MVFSCVNAQRIVACETPGTRFWCVILSAQATRWKCNFHFIRVMCFRSLFHSVNIFSLAFYFCVLLICDRIVSKKLHCERQLYVFVGARFLINLHWLSWSDDDIYARLTLAFDLAQMLLWTDEHRWVLCADIYLWWLWIFNMLIEMQITKTNQSIACVILLCLGFVLCPATSK